MPYYLRVMLFFALALPCSLHQQEELQITPFGSFSGRSGRVTSIAFKHLEPILACGDSKGNIFIYDLEADEILQTLREHKKEITGLAYNMSGDLLVSGGRDGLVILWELPSGCARYVLSHGRDVLTVAFSPDGVTFASAGKGDEIKLWNAESGKNIAVLSGGGHSRVVFLAFNLNGNQLVSVGEERNIIWWDVASKRILRKSEEIGTNLRAAATNIYTDILLLGTETISRQKGAMLERRLLDRKYKDIITVRNWETGMGFQELEGHKDAIKCLALAPDDNIVASGGDERTVKIWDIEKGLNVFNLRTDGRIESLAFSSEGLLLAAALDNGSVASWKISGIQPIKEIDWDSYGVVTGRTAVYSFTTSKAPLLDFVRETVVGFIQLRVIGTDSSDGETVVSTLGAILSNCAKDNNYVYREHEMKALLDEQALQNLGITKESTAVKTGNLMNIDKGLICTLTKPEEFVYVINIRLVDVESGQVEGTRELRCENASGRNLTSAAEKLAAALIPIIKD